MSEPDLEKLKTAAKDRDYMVMKPATITAIIERCERAEAKGRLWWDSWKREEKLAADFQRMVQDYQVWRKKDWERMYRAEAVIKAAESVRNVMQMAINCTDIGSDSTLASVHSDLKEALSKWDENETQRTESRVSK